MSMSNHFKRKKVKRSRTTMTSLIEADAASATTSTSTLTAFDLCLASLQLSTETRESWRSLPPTPLGSPIGPRCSKRARCDPIDEEIELSDVQVEAANSALVMLSSRLESELEMLQKRKLPKKTHQQLGFYAITTAFHRALVERNAAQPCPATE
ncbi:unnamed protein product [Aphanomyces euteiches]|uniref:Uncharacterized protein n=1 Tax=Aphanomyces euteiches TaxID=100861 RepID=A0A6G0XIG8_9STRA|nr:hypothetical protein Ae201684_004478 [Aphanomyces euteiches]KAH9094458.1 hypothetical protein Ae201684P_017064 [Aphanomyces euteiches]